MSRIRKQHGHGGVFPTPKLHLAVGDRCWLSKGTLGTVTAVDPSDRAFPYSVRFDGQDYDVKAGHQLCKEFPESKDHFPSDDDPQKSTQNTTAVREHASKTSNPPQRPPDCNPADPWKSEPSPASPTCRPALAVTADGNSPPQSHHRAPDP